MAWEKPETDNAVSYPCDVSGKNANTAFVFNGLVRSTGRTVFLLPNGVLTSTLSHDVSARKYWIEEGVLSAVILLPPAMFESTSIPTSLLVFDKEKKTDNVVMVDIRDECDIEIREQRGQYGGAAHIARIYKKRLAVVSEKLCSELCRIVDTRVNVPSWACIVDSTDIAKNDYNISPSRYISKAEDEKQHRSFSDIVDDLNRTVEHKNILRLVINGSVAKRLGLADVAELQARANTCTEELREVIQKLTGKELTPNNYILLTKNKNELRFENRHPERISEILSSILQMYKAHLMFLNNEENRLLAELRDALLPKLMSGEIEI